MIDMDMKLNNFTRPGLAGRLSMLFKRVQSIEVEKTSLRKGFFFNFFLSFYFYEHQMPNEKHKALQRKSQNISYSNAV